MCRLHPRWRHTRCLPALGLALSLGGCTSMQDVRSLATGRSDVSVYELNGSDLVALRDEAQRLCPLGGEILRQAGPPVPPGQPTGRWAQALNSAAAWAEPPRQTAQLVVVCREPGDRFRLQAVAAAAAPASAAAAPAAGHLAAILPVGPITPEW